jgi:Xaa-Pro aminopeptidase
MSEWYAQRRTAARARLQTAQLDALLVTSLVNVRYLTGFTGSNAALLLDVTGDDGTLFCTDGRYTDQAAQEVPDLDHVIERVSAVALAARAAKEPMSYGCTGYESHHVTVDARDALGAAAHGIDLIRAPNLVEELRTVKDDVEIEALRMACAIGDRAFTGLIEHGGLRPGRTERQVARDLADLLLDHGAAGPAFEMIVATGANSAIPHHRPTDAVLQDGDLVTLDFGAQVDGYHSDMTRTVVLGAAADWQIELYELVRLAQQAGRIALRPGTDLRAVDAAARTVIEEAGHGEQFPHGLGHGVGLEIHEAPALARTAEGTLAAGMAVTVEPGVYLAGWGGVRIEDTLVVREGEPELLTLTTKKLLVV